MRRGLEINIRGGYLRSLADCDGHVRSHRWQMLILLLVEQFTDFYYNQFDADRKQLAPLYVSYSGPQRDDKS